MDLSVPLQGLHTGVGAAECEKGRKNIGRRVERQGRPGSCQLRYGARFANHVCVCVYVHVLLTKTTRLLAPARPAFDCRGSITIAFAKSSRKITVKLEHTPFHRTVAELAELFKPPPPPVPERPSKKRKAPAAPAPEGGGENGEAAATPAPKKKRKKNAPANPDDPDAPATATPKPKKPRPSRAKKNKAAAEGGAEAAAADGGPDPLLNLSPSEAARRRDEANRKLSEAGIDPATLSTEQFDIFSNQSPDLQGESLAMLVKYGAERLRIVHPSKDSSGAAAPAAANGVVDCAPTPDGSTKKKKSKKRGVNEDGTPKVKKTRGKCQACTAKKIKVRCVFVLGGGSPAHHCRSVPKRSRIVPSVRKRAFRVTTHPKGNEKPNPSQPT